MGVKLFQVTLSHSNCVYWAGDIIHGQVILELDEPTRARAVLLKFLGEANVLWTERHESRVANQRRIEQRYFMSQETYFDQQILLWGTGHDRNEKHPAGLHVYDFQFQLPHKLPSSFEGPFGNVRYGVECVLNIPWATDYKAVLLFTVNCVFDLNERPLTREPMDYEKMKTLCCLCCTSGPITNKLTLDRTGYVPGEYIVAIGEVDNKSNRTMTSSSLVLRQEVIFMSTHKNKTIRRDVAVLKSERVKAGDSYLWGGAGLHIPPVPPSELLHCSIIDIKYYLVNKAACLLQLVTDPAGPAKDLEAPIEITIGTVPLHNVQHMYTSGCTLTPERIMQLAEPGTATVTSPAHTAQAVLPSHSTTESSAPIFAESDLGPINVKLREDGYTFGNTHFTPMYPYYKWNT